MNKKITPQLNLDFEDKESSFSIFHDVDIRLIESLHLPSIIKFHRADKFDSKFVQSSNDIWKYYYSGQKITLNFTRFDENEKKLAKYFLAIYIQINTPSFLDTKLQSYIYTIKKLKENKHKLTFHNLKLLLIDFVKEENSTYYQYLKFLVKLLFLEGFSNFNIDKEYELEFLPRPNAFNSKLFYQQYEDPIDYPLISMIQQGFSKLLHNIKNSNEHVDNQTCSFAFFIL